MSIFEENTEQAMGLKWWHQNIKLIGNGGLE
jgi:hypothetical protein